MPQKQRYFLELEACDGAVEPILERLRAGRATFIFASRETRFNNAVALKDDLESRAE